MSKMRDIPWIGIFLKMLFIYDPHTHQKLMIEEDAIMARYQEFHDWKIWESTTGNPKVSEWYKERTRKEPPE